MDGSAMPTIVGDADAVQLVDTAPWIAALFPTGTNLKPIDVERCQTKRHANGYPPPLPG